MWIGRYDRLRTRTLVFRTDTFRAAYRRTPAKSTKLRRIPLDSRAFGPPAQHRAARRARLIEAGEPRRVRRLAHARGVAACLLCDRKHGVGELVERLLGLGLGRLDHEGALHHQREVDGGRVEAVVEEALGDVE